MTRIIEIELVSRSVYGSLIDQDRYSPDTITEVIAWLQKQLETVPEEFRESAYFEIESEAGGYDEHHATARVYYNRSETDAEAATRIQKAKDRGSEWSREEQQRHLIALQTPE